MTCANCASDWSARPALPNAPRQHQASTEENQVKASCGAVCKNVGSGSLACWNERQRQSAGLRRQWPTVAVSTTRGGGAAVGLPSVVGCGPRAGTGLGDATGGAAGPLPGRSSVVGLLHDVPSGRLSSKGRLAPFTRLISGGDCHRKLPRWPGQTRFCTIWLSSLTRGSRVWRPRQAEHQEAGLCHFSWELFFSCL